jgi:hypothetical protein
MKREAELEEPRLVGPEHRHVVGIQKPGNDEEDGDAEEGPEKEANGKGARDWDFWRLLVKEKSAETADASGKDDASDGGDEALFPRSGHEEEGGVDERVERENAEEERERSGEIQEHDGASWG